jgi:hypothetical protein
MEEAPANYPLDGATFDHVDCIDEDKKNYSTFSLVQLPEQGAVDHGAKFKFVKKLLILLPDPTMEAN